MKTLRAVLAVAASILMSGCAISTVVEAERSVDKIQREADLLLEQARQPMLPKKVSRVHVTNEVWTTSVARRSEHGRPLPRKFETEGVTIINAAPMELFEIGTAITKATGLPVSFAADVFGDQPMAPEGTGKASSDDSTLMGGFEPPDIDNLLGSMGLASGNGAGADANSLRAVTGDRKAMKVDHSGKLSAFLHQVGSHFGVSWEYVNGEIHIYRYVTRTFMVKALPSNIAVSSTLDAGNRTEGAEGDKTGSNQSASSDVSVEIWDELTAAVEAIVGNYGRVTTSVGTGTITVTAPAEVTRRVQRYIDGQNARLSKQVAVSVQVLNVSLTDSDNLDLDLQALFSGSSRYGFSIGNTLDATSRAVGVPGMNFGIIRPDSRWAGSNAVVQALSEQGRVSVVSTASLTTLNGIPAPLQVSNTRNYLERIEVTEDDDSATTALTPGTVTTGFNLSILPRVLDDGSTLMMQFGINISELVGSEDGFDEFTVDGLTIQLPNRNSRSFVQQTMVPNGSTLVLTGFEQMRNQSNRRGMGRPDFMLLGGGQEGMRQRDIIVVILTPVLIDSSAPVISSY